MPDEHGRSSLVAIHSPRQRAARRCCEHQSSSGSDMAVLLGLSRHKAIHEVTTSPSKSSREQRVRFCIYIAQQRGVHSLALSSLPICFATVCGGGVHARSLGRSGRVQLLTTNKQWLMNTK